MNRVVFPIPPFSKSLPGSVRALERILKGYLSRAEVERVHQAYLVGEQAHYGQTRRSGEPYIFHPVAVATILANMAMDSQTIIAALLHDTIEDTAITKDQVATQFGVAVSDLVDGVTKLDKLRFSSRQEAAAASFRKMLLAMAQDIRVILIKLADRLHNVQTLDAIADDKRNRIARETLEVYAPIAQRLGMESMRLELEDLAFRALYPRRYRVIRDHVSTARGRNEERLNTIHSALKTRFQAADLPCRIEGRVKDPYNIYRKMKAKTASFRDVLDVLGFRIVVDDVSACYQALGVVHNLYKPRLGRFKDYIAIPKANGYQSLHTVLFGPFGDPVEVQIRTEEMDMVADQGIAAHWAYKLGQETVDHPTKRAREWLLGVLGMQKQAGNSLEFLEHVKVDLFPDEIYVFTPTGEIRELPRNASVLDFAYAVHTDVGNHAVQAWVDRRLVPLRHRIKSGETIKVITTPSAQPRPSWLDFVVTSKARTAIRHCLKNLAREESVQIGHFMLDKALANVGVSLDAISDRRLQKYLSRIKLPHFENLLADIALGNRLAKLVARQLIGRRRAESATDEIDEVLLLTGSEGHVINYANCCRPIPGDPIMGYLSAGKGIVVHRSSCRNLKEFRKYPDRWIGVGWNPDDQGLFRVGLKIDIHNRPGVLATAASAISETDTNIEHVEYQERDGQTSSLHFLISVRDRKHLARVIRRVRRSQVVIGVRRGT